MFLLIIETSFESPRLILAKDSELLAQEILPSKEGLSNAIVQTLKDLLKKAELPLSSIELIGTSTGPGSYTGIRVGASLAKTLSFAKRIPLVGFSSLFGYEPLFEGSFAIVFDAKEKGFHVLKGNRGQEIYFEKEPSIVEDLSSLEVDFIYSPSELKGRMPPALLEKNFKTQLSCHLLIRATLLHQKSATIGKLALTY